MGPCFISMPKMYYSQVYRYTLVTLIVVLIHMANEAYIVSHTYILSSSENVCYFVMTFVKCHTQGGPLMERKKYSLQHSRQKKKSK